VMLTGAVLKLDAEAYADDSRHMRPTVCVGAPFTVPRNMDAIIWSGAYNLDPECFVERTVSGLC